MTINGYDAKAVIAVAAFVFASGGIWHTTRAQVEENSSKIEEVEQGVKKIEDLEERVQEQAKGINWIGEAIEKIATEQEIQLPRRKIVPEQ